MTIKAAQKKDGKFVNWGASNYTDTAWVRFKFVARRIKGSIVGRDGAPLLGQTFREHGS
jgi:hypothetical protein